MVSVLVPPSETAPPLIVIELLFNAAFGIPNSCAPLPLNTLVVLILPVANIPPSSKEEPEIALTN